MDADNRARRIYRVTAVGLAVNVALAAGKLAAGLAGRSGAMIADAVHSVSDFATDIVVLVCVRLSSRPRDEDHDYGHGKYETLASVLIGLALAAVAIGIFANSVGLIKRVVEGEQIPRPGLVAVIAAGVSIIVKEALYRYTVVEGRRLNSPAVVANAWHHRSDALSSVATLVGIGGARFLGGSWRILDPIAAIMVSALIVKVAYDLVVSGVNELVEHSLPASTEKEIIDIVTSDGNVSDPHNLKTRRIGQNIAVEVHIRLPHDMTVGQSHSITVGIERRLRERFGDGTQTIIHVEPLKNGFRSV